MIFSPHLHFPGNFSHLSFKLFDTQIYYTLITLTFI